MVVVRAPERRSYSTYFWKIVNFHEFSAVVAALGGGVVVVEEETAEEDVEGSEEAGAADVVVMGVEEGVVERSGVRD